jgi:hypothetical protein
VKRETRAKLVSDPTLASLLPGGIWDAAEITRQLTPTAFDANGEIRPCALVKLETESSVDPYPTGSRLFVLVLFYELSGYVTIDLAMERVYALLHRGKIGSNVWEVDHTNDVLDLKDPALNCSLAMSRYMFTRLR